MTLLYNMIRINCITLIVYNKKDEKMYYILLMKKISRLTFKIPLFYLKIVL